MPHLISPLLDVLQLMATSALPLAGVAPTQLSPQAGAHPPFVLLQTTQMASSDVAERVGDKRVAGGDGSFLPRTFHRRLTVNIAAQTG